MTDIRIRRLTLENFKCHRHLELDFDGRNASIYGDNATGKTSIYDALTWLLFGKDSQGNGEKNIEIKPLDSTGQVRDHDGLTEVSAVLTVGGEEVSLRRTYREVWTTKRGSSIASYDGNTSEYYYNGVPCKYRDYTDRIGQFLDEEVFRMLTSVSYFASQLHWQERRGILFRLIGAVDDRQILQQEPRFSELYESLGQLTLEEYKKKLLSEKKKFMGAKTDIPARISECEKTIADVADLDYAGAKAEAARLQAAVDGVSARILAISHDAAAEQKRMEIREQQITLSQLEADNKAFRNTQLANQPDLHSLQISLTAMKTRLDRKKREMTNEEAFLHSIGEKIENARRQWISCNGESRTVADTCPTCGQNLPADQVRKALAVVEAEKQKRLDEILSQANSFKELKAGAEARISNIRDELQQIQEEMEAINDRIKDEESAVVPVDDMPDYDSRKKAINARIDMLSRELADMMQDTLSVRDALQQEKEELQQLLSSQQIIINKEALLEYSKNRVEQLREDARNTAAGLEAIEKMLYLMEEFARFKTGALEESVNRQFRLARFRLFREQANGGLEERCDVVYDGIPYGSINNGMKINLGIDIINTLSLAESVKVPLFVDNAESVTNLEACGSQIIRLVVSQTDKELRVDYEN